MLALTESAAGIVREIVASAPQIEDAESGGLRVTATGEGFQLAVVAGPHEDDQVVEGSEGARVFLEPSTVAYLDDKMLDAYEESGRVSFAISEQTGV
jgi:Fe-S cluster assembly iron-binding protein IscA